MNSDDLEKYGVYELINERFKNNYINSNSKSNTETISTPILRDRKEEERTEFKKRINKEIREGKAHRCLCLRQSV